MIELSRANLLDSLEKLADSGHVLVVGEPGAGKSWLLKEFVSRRRAGGDGVVFLRAEDHAVGSLSDLYESIGVIDFLAALRGYSGERKFLVIDSLDSLRTEGSQRAFRDLIRSVQSEVPAFTVVASIRTFDMQRSPELHELFPFTDHVPSNAQEYSARHLLVPVLSETELQESLIQDERLRPIVGSASSEAKNLLRNPFNLWLVIHLLDAGAPINWLSTIQSEVQLLDHYWFYRIEARDDGISKTALLKVLTERMVDSRLMSVSLRDLSPSEILDAPINKLLSDEILRKSDTGRISYVHNILFDFAISKLLIDEQNVMTFLLSGPARAIFYRPSVSYLMTRLWFRDRVLYWKLAEVCFERRPQNPAIVSITAARSIFDLARAKDDLAPLFAFPAETRIRAIVFLLRAIRALDELDSNISQNRFQWISFLVTSLEYLDTQFLNESVALVEATLQNAATDEEVQALTLVAIHILRWIWNKAESESDISAARNLADFAAARLIPIVAKNYWATPEASKLILYELIGRLNNIRSSASEAFRIASNLDSVIECDPALASDIYVAILGHDETSDEETHLGGAVLPLLSRRSQDFSLSYYVLGTKFGKLVARDSTIAARTAARSVTATVKIKESNAIKSLRAYVWTFHFLGKQITLNSDRSDIWDHYHRDYTAIQMIDQLLNILKRELESGKLSPDAARSILCELGQANEFAVTWKRVLTYASHTPEFLAIIPDLLQVPELLAAPETTEAAGAAIREAYEKELFSPAEFSAIQESILRITTLPLASIFHEPRYVRDALLECIPAENREAAALAALEGRKADGARQRTDSAGVGLGAWGPDEEDGWLKRQGVDTERSDNRTLLTATRALKSFERQFSQAQTPSSDDAEAVREGLWNAYQLVKENAGDERVVTDALTTVAAVAKCILRIKGLAGDRDVITSCKAIISYAAVYPFPQPPEDADANFDRPAWSPTPKIEAAQGIMNYLCNWGMDEKLKMLAVSLSADPSPAVRLQIAMSLINLYEKNRDWFWKIANERLPVENAIGVLASLAHAVTHPYVAKRELKAVIGWEASLLGRELPPGRTDELLKTLAHSLTDLYVFFGDEDASEALKIFEREPAKYSKELAQVALSGTFYLADGLKEDDHTRVAKRARAREVWARALVAADVVISTYFSNPKPASGDNVKKEQEVLKGALSIIDSAVFQLYLLFHVKEHLVREDLPSLDDPQRRKLFIELDPIWRLLLGPTGPQHKGLLPASTTHHLVEIFRTTVSYDPARVLQLTTNLFKGFNMGYQSDQLAIGEVVSFAEIIMADYKEILKDPTNAGNLAFILDQFVEFGWPQATRVLMKLDTAVR